MRIQVIPRSGNNPENYRNRKTLPKHVSLKKLMHNSLKCRLFCTQSGPYQIVWHFNRGIISSLFIFVCVLNLKHEHYSSNPDLLNFSAVGKCNKQSEVDQSVNLRQCRNTDRQSVIVIWRIILLIFIFNFRMRIMYLFCSFITIVYRENNIWKKLDS